MPAHNRNPFDSINSTIFNHPRWNPGQRSSQSPFAIVTAPNYTNKKSMEHSKNVDRPPEARLALRKCRITGCSLASKWPLVLLTSVYSQTHVYGVPLALGDNNVERGFIVNPSTGQTVNI